MEYSAIQPPEQVWALRCSEKWLGDPQPPPQNPSRRVTERIKAQPNLNVRDATLSGRLQADEKNNEYLAPTACHIDMDSRGQRTNPRVKQDNYDLRDPTIAEWARKVREVEKSFDTDSVIICAFLREGGRPTISMCCGCARVEGQDQLGLSAMHPVRDKWRVHKDSKDRQVLFLDLNCCEGKQWRGSFCQTPWQNTGTAPAILSKGRILPETSDDVYDSSASSLSLDLSSPPPPACYARASPPENRTALEKMSSSASASSLSASSFSHAAPRLLRYCDPSAACNLRVEPLQNALRAQLHQGTLPHRVGRNSRHPRHAHRPPLPASCKFPDGSDYHTLPMLQDTTPGAEFVLGDLLDIACYLASRAAAWGGGGLFPMDSTRHGLDYSSPHIHDAVGIAPLSTREATAPDLALRLQAPLFRLSFTPGAHCLHARTAHILGTEMDPQQLSSAESLSCILSTPTRPQQRPFPARCPRPALPRPRPPPTCCAFAYAYPWSLTAPSYRRLVCLLPHRHAARRAHSSRADNSLTSTHSLLIGPLPATRFPPGSHLTAINAIIGLDIMDMHFEDNALVQNHLKAAGDVR
ncbi:hypothetical protein B0H14DRAFT_2605416 [Mycena olivaceomarginata]|nr:hypothetical protein B0H14DRAFT_2605416 [Mycena olivaceomarginata]